MSHPGRDPVAAVLQRYPSGCRGAARSLGNSGGFSGARLWQVMSPSGLYCLRIWPPDDAFPARLDYLHALMTTARQDGLDFVPRVETTLDGSTRVEHGGRWWELIEWRPGRADFRA